MNNKRNPIGNEFDNKVIEEMMEIAGTIGDHLFLARIDSYRLQEYIKEYDDGSWKFAFIKDAQQDIFKIESKFENLWKVLETFKDPE